MRGKNVDTHTPINIALEKTRGLTITWADQTVAFYPIAYLRKMSPSADMKEMRREQHANPLAVLPDKYARHDGPLTALDAELIGNYALRIRFSDGHDTGIYSWEYLRNLQPDPTRDGSPGA